MTGGNPPPPPAELNCYFIGKFWSCRNFNTVVCLSNCFILVERNLQQNKHKSIRIYQKIYLFQFQNRYVMLKFKKEVEMLIRFLLENLIFSSIL